MKRWVGIPTLLLFAVTAFAGEGSIRRRENAIKGEYIVVLQDFVPADEVPEVARRVARAHGAAPARIWSSALKGFFVVMPEGRAEALSRHPDVAFVEENAQMFLSSTGTINNTKVDVPTCDPWTNNCSPVIDNRLWHLDRLGQTWAAPDHKHTSCYDGTGVTVYVVDSGVKRDHQEFLDANGNSRVATTGYDATQEGPYYPAHDPCNGWPGDVPPLWKTESQRYAGEWGNNGHGTSAASLVAGNRLGVANNATIVPVKVMPCRYNSARARRASTSYQVGDLVWNLGTGDGPDKYWTCIYPGTTGSGSFPTTDIVNRPGERLDGSVEWQLTADPPSSTPRDTTAAYVTDAFNWIRGSNNQNAKTKAVVTISVFLATGELTAPPLSALEMAIDNLIAAGIPIVASANNQNADACATTPARRSRTNPTASLRGGVITVGGTMIRNNPDFQTGLPAVESANGTGDDTSTTNLEPEYVATQSTRDARWICGAGDSTPCPLAAGSNAGPCVTIFAPAKNLATAAMRDHAADYRDPRRRKTSGSGTSWATPQVAGVVAKIIQKFPTSTVNQIHDKLIAYGIRDALDPADLHPSGVACDGQRCTDNLLVNFSDVAIATQPQDRYRNGPTALSVAADRTDVQYQWYQVNAGFDLSHRTGAYTSTLLAGETSPSLTRNPPTTTAYWVRVTASCGQAESRIAVITVLPPPQNLTATGLTETSVQLQWAAASGAPAGATYRIRYRASMNAAWLPVATTASTSYTHNTNLTRGMMVQYEVTTTLSDGVSDGVFDYAVTRPYSEDPAFSTTKVRGIHIGELREAADAWRGFVGTLPDAFSSYGAATGKISAANLDAIVTALNAARGPLGLPNFAFSGGAPAGGQKINKEHVNQLRNAMR